MSNIYNYDETKGDRNAKILKTYVDQPIAKAEVADLAIPIVEESKELVKGGKKAFIGEKREFAGRMYIKTATGWKFFGKGTGAKATEHHASSAPVEPAPKSGNAADERYRTRQAEQKAAKEKLASLLEKEKVTETPPPALEEVEPTKTPLPTVGSTVQMVNHPDLPSSLIGLGRQNLKVVGYEKGTSTVPNFLTVQDESGEKHSLDPNDIEEQRSTAPKDSEAEALKEYEQRIKDHIASLKVHPTDLKAIARARKAVDQAKENWDRVVDKSIAEIMSKVDKATPK